MTRFHATLLALGGSGAAWLAAAAVASIGWPMIGVAAVVAIAGTAVLTLADLRPAAVLAVWLAVVVVGSWALASVEASWWARVSAAVLFGTLAFAGWLVVALIIRRLLLSVAG